MKEKNTIDNIREWINTGAALIAIAAGIYGFCILKSDNENMRNQMTQITKTATAAAKIAIAADSQITELRKHTKILEDHYLTDVENVKINKSRYAEEIMPYFGFKYSQTIEDMADGGDWLLNIGSKAKILDVEYGKNNTFTVEYPKNTFIEKDIDNAIYLQPRQGKNIIRKVDFTIIMENMNGDKYQQRFYSDSKNALIAVKPVRIP
jgi:hypothetical protein